jgi:lactate dehydrogenase-like 2-hydroxyacid dehydrogenase
VQFSVLVIWWHLFKHSIISMKIVFLDTRTMGEVSNMDLISSLGEVLFYPVIKASETLERLQGAEIAITCKVIIDKPLMQKLPDLKLICIAATGTNNIDLEYAKKAGIAVKNVTDYSTNSVAQSVFALILALLNKTAYYDNYVRSGKYSENDMFTHIGKPVYELFGKKFGIIGLGAIGKRVAQIAEAFGCKICFYSTSGKNLNTRYEQLALDDLLISADIISIHCPLNEVTRNLIGYDKIKLMKSTALLVNTSRGGIVDEIVLARALDENCIAGAGFDVFSKEPIEPLNPLLHIKDKEKIIFSPHNAWTSVEARELLIKRISANIKEYQNNRRK